jgi:hypothetical protein
MSALLGEASTTNSNLKHSQKMEGLITINIFPVHITKLQYTLDYTFLLLFIN